MTAPVGATAVGVTPVGATEFAALMAAVDTAAPVAVAVSGGADSMALVLCAARWAPGQVLALTVDHGLRAAAAEEAATVGRWLAARGISHRILAWTGPKPATGIQEAAREARHGLLAAACRAAGIGTLLLAHHAHDQMETVLMRLGRGSGPAGLRGMMPVHVAGGVRLVRPFLDLTPDRLRATLHAAGQAWIEDPSNADRRFQRVRLRALLPALAEAGVGPAGLAAAVGHLREAEDALTAAVADLAGRALVLDPAGHAWLDPAPFTAAHPEIRRRLVEALARIVGGATGHLDRARATALADAVAGGPMAGRTFGGCRFVPMRGGILVCREWSRILPETPLADGLCWDGRIAVAAPGGGNGLTLRPLGTRHGVVAGGMPAVARAALPAVWCGSRLLAVPHLGYRLETARGDRVFPVTLTLKPHRLPAGFDSVLASADPCVISL